MQQLLENYIYPINKQYNCAEKYNHKAWRGFQKSKILFILNLNPPVPGYKPILDRKQKGYAIFFYFYFFSERYFAEWTKVTSRTSAKLLHRFLILLHCSYQTLPYVLNFCSGWAEPFPLSAASTPSVLSVLSCQDEWAREEETLGLTTTSYTAGPPMQAVPGSFTVIEVCCYPLNWNQKPHCFIDPYKQTRLWDPDSHFHPSGT